MQQKLLASGTVADKQSLDHLNMIVNKTQHLSQIKAKNIKDIAADLSVSRNDSAFS